MTELRPNASWTILLKIWEWEIGNGVGGDRLNSDLFTATARLHLYFTIID
jgi:hypothetical protein